MLAAVRLRKLAVTLLGDVACTTCKCTLVGIMWKVRLAGRVGVLAVAERRVAPFKVARVIAARLRCLEILVYLREKKGILMLWGGGDIR